jgi:hypothetical protein
MKAGSRDRLLDWRFSLLIKARSYMDRRFQGSGLLNRFQAYRQVQQNLNSEVEPPFASA